MEPDPPDGGQVSVQGLADQVVREPVTTDRSGNGLYQPRMDRFVDRVERVFGAQVANGAQEVNAELRSLCGSELERDRGWRLEVSNPASDDGAHAGRHRNPQRREIADVGEATLGLQEAKRFT